MKDTNVVELALKAMVLSAKLGAPILIVSMAVGVLIGMLQAATQLQEPTVTFVPKLFAVGVTILVAGSWMLNSAVSFTRELFDAIPGLLR